MTDSAYPLLLSVNRIGSAGSTIELPSSRVTEIQPAFAVHASVTTDRGLRTYVRVVIESELANVSYGVSAISDVSLTKEG